MHYPGIAPPAFFTAPSYSRTLGPEVADLCDQVGFGPDPEQRMLLDLIFAYGEGDAPGGLPFATPQPPSPRNTPRLTLFELAVICCRQNLKTGLFKQAAIGWMFLTHERLVLWSAHEFDTALEAFGDMDEIITGSDMLRKRVKSVHRSHGAEGFELYGRTRYGRGGRLKFKARTKSGGRGLSGDKVVLDEAFALIPTHMGTLIPTMSARPAPQILYGSSAGLPHSDVLRGIRDRGRKGGRRLGYVEWCDPTPNDQFVCLLPKCNHTPGQRGCLLDDESRWLQANPAIGRRITIDYIRSEREALPPDEFMRERMGRWDDPTSDSPVPLALWAARADARSEIRSGGAMTLGIDVSPGNRSAAIGLYGMREDRRGHIEMASHGPGVSWVVDRAVELDAKHSPVGWALDPYGPAGGLLSDLKKAGINVTEMSARDMGQGCGTLADDVRNGALAHREVPTEEDPSAGPMSRAVAGAGRRDIGDGMWGWLRRRSDADICPIVAATAARWLFSELGPDDDDEPGVYYL